MLASLYLVLHAIGTWRGGRDEWLLCPDPILFALPWPHQENCKPNKPPYSTNSLTGHGRLPIRSEQETITATDAWVLPMEFGRMKSSQVPPPAHVEAFLTGIIWCGRLQLERTGISDSGGHFQACGWKELVWGRQRKATIIVKSGLGPGCVWGGQERGDSNPSSLTQFVPFSKSLSTLSFLFPTSFPCLCSFCTAPWAVYATDSAWLLAPSQAQYTLAARWVTQLFGDLGHGYWYIQLCIVCTWIEKDVLVTAPLAHLLVGCSRHCCTSCSSPFPDSGACIYTAANLLGRLL